ncbi:uncharacterized [Tachysurus ichikawai]
MTSVLFAALCDPTQSFYVASVMAQVQVEKIRKPAVHVGLFWREQKSNTSRKPITSHPGALLRISWKNLPFACCSTSQQEERGFYNQEPVRQNKLASKEVRIVLPAPRC